MPTDVGQPLPPLTLADPDGELVPLERYVGRPLLLQLLRYYG